MTSFLRVIVNKQQRVSDYLFYFCLTTVVVTIMTMVVMIIDHLVTRRMNARTLVQNIQWRRLANYGTVT